MEEFQCYFELDDQKTQQGVRATCCPGSAHSARPPASSSCRCPRSPPGSARATCSGCSTATGTTTCCGSRCGAPPGTCPWPSSGTSPTARATTARACRSATSSRASASSTACTDDAPTVRTYLADGEDAEVICLAARKLREKARTLSGDALGVELDEPESDIAADLLDVMGGDSGLWWETAAERLAEHFPMRHADATAESVSAAARARGVPSTDVRWPPGRTGTNRKGCRKADLDRRGTAMRPRHMCRAGAARADLRKRRRGAAHRRACRAPCRAPRCR